ncbi:P-loop containing nucleoside triphosphate hydrolase protein [Aspergillus aurantiobrunneus]
MERFLLDNVQRYHALVGRFKPPHVQEAKAGLQTSPNLVVATRIRPVLEKESQLCHASVVFPRPGDSGAVDVHQLRHVVRGLPTLDTTATIYEEVAQPLLPWVWQGRVGTLFAYGQTSSGETFTVSGLERLVAHSIFGGDWADRHRSISLFSSWQATLHLLNERAPCQILEDAFGTTQLAGVVEEHVASSEHLLHSSRSHAISRIRVEDASPTVNPDGFLYMIDLAGSEAARDIANHAASRMKETREINISLSTLKDCIRARALMDLPLSAGKKVRKPYIPLRQSALTKVLKHLFDPHSSHHCKTAILTRINPSLLDVGASKNTLRYAKMLRVAVPKTTPVESDPRVPASWNNEDVRNFIKLQSGYPAISGYDLAPTESGLQLLRLPDEDFVQRCLQTPGVADEQARAFHSNLWAMHCPAEKVDVEKVKLPFKDRIRPGMAVRWTRSGEASQLALVLSPEGDAGKGYLCALVVPGTLANAYEVHLWRQSVVSVDAMEAEVLLEYHRMSRYYFIAV